MQNKGYIEAITDARLFADFMGSTIEKVEQIVRTANAKQQRINGEYQQLERQLQSTKSSADRLCSAEKRRRDNAARHAVEHMKAAVKKTYGLKGEKIVNMNIAAVDKGMDALVEIKYPESWADATEGAEVCHCGDDDYIAGVVRPILAQRGDKLPVSAMEPAGIMPLGTAACEKRGVAINVPEWVADNCIQCCQCSFVCPHAAIRPVVANDEELAGAPESFVTVPAKGKELTGMKFRMQVYAEDCLGCGSCVEVCPTKPEKRALSMKPLDTQIDAQVANLAFAEANVSIKDDLMARDTVKGSQLQQPLHEFSGACAGCGETPYVKVLTQLFGERMLIANATGCSSIWGASSPTTPYTTNKDGFGPAWGNSLFEDAAEFGCGIGLGYKQRRGALALAVKEALATEGIDDELKASLQGWLDNMDDAEGSRKFGEEILDNLDSLSEADHALAHKLWDMGDLFTKKSVWIFGGDGWAYDIGYGGLDHVLASGDDINVLVMDTEVYSNTGGQASKATNMGATAQFAAAAKRTKKKDLGRMLMSYGYIYVAQVAMGADPAQTLRAIREAESYPGPAVVIAYAPCTAHGIPGGMSHAQQEMKRAVESGYWNLYRYDPRLAAEGKNPFQLDSKTPTGDYVDFIKGERRFAAMAAKFPKEAEELFEHAQRDATERYETYVAMSEQK